MTIYSRRGLHGQITDLLGSRIVNGDIPEGAILDVEGLCAEMNVSRTVVREMLRALATKGLVDARPRIGTFVLPRGQWNLLDAEIMRWRGEAGPSSALLGDLGDLRRLIEPWCASRAAAHRTQQDLDDIRGHLERLASISAHDGIAAAAALDAHIDADVAFHSAILKATGNELATRLIVILEPLLRFRDALIPESEQTPGFLELHWDVYGAIEAGDPDAAEQATITLLDAAAHDLTKVLATDRDRTEAQADPSGSRPRDTQ